jgi:hypothetical protein
MTPAMYERVRNYFVDAGLTTGFIVQLLAWDDTTKLTDAFIVFRPNGGTDIRNDLGSDHYVLVDVISAKDKRRAAAEAQEIINYVEQNDITDECLGLIQNLGNMPYPDRRGPPGLPTPVHVRLRRITPSPTHQAAIRRPFLFERYMQGCANDFGKLIGKVAVLRMAFGCPDAVPALSEWKRLGAMTTKGIDYSMNTINSEADDAKGLVENLVNNMDLTISGEGEFRKSDKDNEIGAWRLSKYIFDEVQAGRQPNLWVRFDFAGENAGTYIQGYMNTTSWSGDFGTNDISTFSGEWKVYDADTVVFEVADSIAATGVEVTPATASLVVGATQQLSGAVQPTDATNKAITWTTSAPSIATVSSTGLVTAVAAGTATITATTADGNFHRHLCCYRDSRAVITTKGGVLPLILVMENDMTPLKEIGECLIGAGEREYFFRPSFRNMTRIGEPEHIVRTFYALFNDDVAKMLEAAREIHSAIPEHQRRFYAHYFGDVSLPMGA